MISDARHAHLSPDALVHHTGEGLVDGHGLLSDRRRVIDRNVLEIIVRAPVFVCDEISEVSSQL